MEDEHEQIKVTEKPSIKRVTSEIYNNNNTSGYVSDSSDNNDVIVDTEVSESVASQRSVLTNLSSQFSGLTAGGSESGKRDDIVDADISKAAVPERSILDDLRNQLFSLPARESQAPHHETVSLLEQPPDKKTSSDSKGLPKLPSPPKHSPIYDEEYKSASPIEMDAIDSMSSQSSLCSNSYLCSLASFDLPSMLQDDDEVEILWPLKEEFSLSDQCKFEEGDDYQLATVDVKAGAYGKCYLATVRGVDTEEERVVCVKKCKYEVNELLALSLARKNEIAEIVKFYGATVKRKTVCIFMEYMAGGTIAELIKEMEIPETDSLRFLEVVLKALEFLHCKGIVHRDIKGDNVLLDLEENGSLSPKLADFGSAESAMEREVRPSFDIWRTGCLLLEMLNRERPLRLIDERALQRQNSCKPEEFIPSEAMDVTKGLLRLLFGLDGSFPTAAAVLRHSEAFPVTELLNRLTKESQSLEKST
nr:uncharacterized protein LOC131795325 [Pocillopora verrucosa]